MSLCDTWNSAENRLFLKKKYFSKTPSSGPRECYELSPCVDVPPFRTFAEMEFGWTTHARPILRDLSLLLAVQVCVVPLASCFCSCSLMYAAMESWSILTTDHAHFRTRNLKYAHLKFMVYSCNKQASKHTHALVQCSLTSVGAHSGSPQLLL